MKMMFKARKLNEPVGLFGQLSLDVIGEVVCRLSRDGIGYEDSKCYWCVTIRLLYSF